MGKAEEFCVRIASRSTPHDHRGFSSITHRDRAASRSHTRRLWIMVGCQGRLDASTRRLCQLWQNDPTYYRAIPRSAGRSGENLIYMDAFFSYACNRGHIPGPHRAADPGWPRPARRRPAAGPADAGARCLPMPGAGEFGRPGYGRQGMRDWGLSMGEAAVEYVNLGASGVRVSRVCLGMMSYGNGSERPWVLDEDAAGPIVQVAAEGGITFFDTADAYSGGASEVATGRLLAKFVSRDDVVVATKVFMPVGSGENNGGLSRKHILAGIDAALRRLDMDYVDLYQIHRWDYRTPIEETMQALHDVVRAGKARYIGASSMYAWQFAKAQHAADAHGWTRFVSMQNHYNLVYREEEREMIPQCIDQGVAVIPWSPLARGLLAGNRTRDGERRTTRSGTDPFGDSLYKV